MSKANPLGLIGQYGYSDDDSDDEELTSSSSKLREDIECTEAPGSSDIPLVDPASIYPAPIPHCPWSACYDEASGYTYYWNQETNVVTWDPPPEYLLALKLARQHLQVTGNTEVSAEEWQLYQQALAEKEKNAQKPAPPVSNKQKAVDKKTSKNSIDIKKKRKLSDSEDEKIELITSYQHSDSDSNEELDTPVKVPPKSPPKPDPPKMLPKPPLKKQKPKQVVEFGPALPPNQTYTVPIGPELPPDLIVEVNPEKNDAQNSPKEIEEQTESKSEDDEKLLLEKLKYKTKLLEKLGGEIPNDVKNLIKESPPEIASDHKEADLDTNVDDLLESIEKTEMNKKLKPKSRIDMFDDNQNVGEIDNNKNSSTNSPKNVGSPKDEIKPLFPSSASIVEEPVKSLFPSAVNIVENGDKTLEIAPTISEKKNIYIQECDNGETVEKGTKKKMRICNSVLPEKKQASVPSYTTKYAQFIDGFSLSGRTGLGFNQHEEMEDNENKPKQKNKGISSMFTKGETLNEKEDLSSLEDRVTLVSAKLKFLNELQTYNFSPVQEMAIQLQTLLCAYKAEALSLSYWRQWVDSAAQSLLQLEATAAPSGWTCTFHREQGRYQYRRESDGFVQTEYPSNAHNAHNAHNTHNTHEDMDICTTPPPTEDTQESVPESVSPPPPPSWSDPPPPPPEVDPPPPPNITEIPKRECLGDELMSFYNDIAEMEKLTKPEPEVTKTESPPPPPTIPTKLKEETTKSSKKKRIKISSIASKNKNVSNLVAKWQQVAEEIHSDD